MSNDKVEDKFSKRTSQWKLILVLLIVALVITVILSLNIGYAPIPFQEVLAIIGKHVPFVNSLLGSSPIPHADEAIILQIRFPRIVAGALVGAALACAGVLYQGIFKNPMADSYVLGVSSGASVGASVCLVLGISFSLFGLGTIQVAAFIGALLTIFLVYNISRVGSRVPVTTLLLSGVAVSFFLAAVVYIMEVFAGNQLHAIVFWIIGGFSNVEWIQIWSILPFIVVGTVLAYFFARDLNMMAFGEDTAQHLGVNTERVKKLLLVFSSLITAAAVSISGPIMFVGLLIPHITRILIGPDHRILFPTSAIVGAIFLIACDATARVITGAVELPVGIITALAGGPFFIYLLRKKKQSYGL